MIFMGVGVRKVAGGGIVYSASRDGNTLLGNPWFGESPPAAEE
jgi:hypothetical protein